jgi:hypothetical protein
MDFNNNVAFNKPSIAQIGLSLSTWFVMFIGLLAVRAETHPWMNTVILTVLFPLYLWFMSRNNILGSVSQGAILATVIGAGLFMTLLLEARKNSEFSMNLKKNLKEYGRDPKGTAYASLAVAVSLMMGAGVSFTVLGDNFLRV